MVDSDSNEVRGQMKVVARILFSKEARHCFFGVAMPQVNSPFAFCGYCRKVAFAFASFAYLRRFCLFYSLRFHFSTSGHVVSYWLKDTSHLKHSTWDV